MPLPAYYSRFHDLRKEFMAAHPNSSVSTIEDMLNCEWNVFNIKQWLTDTKDQRSQSFFRYFPTVVLNCSQILAGIEPNLEFDVNHKVWSTTFLCCPINPDRQLIIFYPFQTWSSRQMWRTATPTWRTSLTWQKFCRNSSVMVSLTLRLFKWAIPIKVTRWLVGIINFAKVGGKLCQTLNKFPKSFANFAKSGQTDWAFIYFTTH